MNAEILQICQGVIITCIILYVLEFIGDIIKTRRLKRILKDHINDLERLKGVKRE